MSRKPMTVSGKYSKYTKTTIILSENGIKYEFLIGKFLFKMENLFNKEEYKSVTEYNVKMDKFLNELNKEFQEKKKERSAPSCGSYKTFERNFEKVIEKENGKRSDEEELYCINIIKDMEFFFNTKFLSDPEESLHKKNDYIHSLILPLIDIMLTSDLFNYIPYTRKSPGYQCYWNHMRMIENNIKILFKDEKAERYDLWQEILEPLRRIIGDGDDDESYRGGDFPGISSGIWLDANPVLAYFDCVYDIADKNYQLYEKIIKGGKVHFSFKIGEDELEVSENIKKRTSYFIKQGIRNGLEYNFEKEKQVFFTEFRKAYLEIVKQYMNIYSV